MLGIELTSLQLVYWTITSPVFIIFTGDPFFQTSDDEKEVSPWDKKAMGVSVFYFKKHQNETKYSHFELFY